MVKVLENIVRVNVSLSIEEAATVTGAGFFEKGDRVMLQSTVNKGYRLANWTIDGVIKGESRTYSFVAESDVDVVANFILSTIGIDNLKDNVQIYIKNGIIFVSSYVQTIGQIEILDNDGRIIRSVKFSGINQGIHMNEVSRGVYFVRFCSLNGSFVKKVII